MGVQKIAGFFFSTALGIVVLLATVVFAYLTYRRRRDKGFLFLLCALACGLLSKVIILLFLGPGTFFPLDYSGQQFLGRIVGILNTCAPILALAGWVMLARAKKNA